MATVTQLVAAQRDRIENLTAARLQEALGEGDVTVIDIREPAEIADTGVAGLQPGHPHGRRTGPRDHHRWRHRDRRVRRARATLGPGDRRAADRVPHRPLRRDPVHPLELRGDELLYADGGVIRRFPRDVDDLISLARGLVTRDLTQDECLRHLGAQRCAS